MRFSRLPARAAPAEVGSLGAWAACGCRAQTGRVLPYGAAGTCSQQPCEGSDACHRGRPCPLPRVVPWARVCLAGHFLLPVAVKGGVGGGFTAQQGWCPCAPPPPLYQPLVSASGPPYSLGSRWKLCRFKDGRGVSA